MSQYGLPTQPAGYGGTGSPPSGDYEESSYPEPPQPSPTDKTDRVVISGAINVFLATLLVAVTTAFFVSRGKVDDYRQSAAAADRRLDSVVKAENQRKRSFKRADLRDLFSQFETALADVTRTGNEIDNATDEVGISLYPAYRNAMMACRTAMSKYNNAARRYPQEYFAGAKFPAMIDIGDSSTNCIDDMGED